MNKEMIKGLLAEYEKLEKLFLSSSFEKKSFEDKHAIIEKMLTIERLKTLYKLETSLDE